MKKSIYLTLLSLSIFVQNIFGQSSTPGNLWGGTANEYLGWDNASNTSLNIKTELNKPINFYTFAGPAGFANKRMTILGGNGHVGIGLNHTPSNDILDIKPDAAPAGTNTGLGLFNWTDGFSSTVLHNWGTNNIFVGVGAGAVNFPATGANNSFFGYNAGNANINGDRNTLIGCFAGSLLLGARYNTFIGYAAGAAYIQNGLTDNTFVGYAAGGNSIGGLHNTFIGDEAGLWNSTGDRNTTLGAHAGQLNYIGQDIVCLGFDAGHNNTADSNIYAGAHSGQKSINGTRNSFFGGSSGFENTTGSDNTFIGYNSGCDATTPGLTNSSTLGANAVVMNPNNIILGDPAVNVGIGLSGMATGPARKLEINSVISVDPSIDDIPGSSGLRFRDFRAPNSLATSLPVVGVISTNHVLI